MVGGVEGWFIFWQNLKILKFQSFSSEVRSWLLNNDISSKFVSRCSSFNMNKIIGIFSNPTKIKIQFISQFWKPFCPSWWRHRDRTGASGWSWHWRCCWSWWSSSPWSSGSTRSGSSSESQASSGSRWPRRTARASWRYRSWTRFRRPTTSPSLGWRCSWRSGRRSGLCRCSILQSNQTGDQKVGSFSYFCVRKKLRDPKARGWAVVVHLMGCWLAQCEVWIRSFIRS